MLITGVNESWTIGILIAKSGNGSLYPKNLGEHLREQRDRKQGVERRGLASSAEKQIKIGVTGRCQD